MALTPIQAIQRLPVDGEILHDISHGPATGPASLVQTEGGVVPTAARAIDQVQQVSAQAISDIQALTAAQGYQVPVAYTSGIQITLRNQTVEYNGQAYAPILSALPFTTSGTFETAKFRLIQGVSVADLSGSGGASIIGYSPAEKPSFNISVKKALDETVDLKTKFGLTGDPNVDQTAQWNDLIAYVNGLQSWGGTVRVNGCYRITGAHQSILNGIALIGNGVSRSRLLFDTGVAGLTFDFSRFARNGIGVLLKDLSLTTNSTDQIAIATIAPTGNASYQLLSSSRVFLCSESRWRGDSQSVQPEEWKIGYDLGVLGSANKYSEVHIDQPTIYGSYLNAAYGTRTASIGIRANNVTGLRIDRPKIGMAGTGLQMRGQSEGLVMVGGTMLGIDKGVVVSDFTNPANNHVIYGTHINPHTRGIQVFDSADSTSFSGMHKFTDLLILETASPTKKVEGFIGIDALCSSSEMSNVQVRSNNPPEDPATGTLKIAFQIGSNHNKLNSCRSHNMNYPLNITGYSNGTAAGNVWMTRFQETGTRDGLLYPGSRMPLGDMAGDKKGASYLMDYWSSRHYMNAGDGSEWLTEQVANRKNGNPGGTQYYWDVKSSSSTATYDGRIYFSGGDTANNASGRAQCIVYGSVAYFNADAVGPYTDNSTTGGTPARRYSTVYAGTGSINTSDARYKTAVTALSDAEIACGQQLAREIGWYKWLASVDEKGASARKHFGMTVQRAIAVFELHGLDPFTYGAICHDVIPAEDEITLTPEDGAVEIISPARDASDIYSFRWDELSAFIMRCIAAENDALSARVAAIEAKLDAPSA